MKASKEVDLVVAVLQYAARCLKEGDLAALRDMKFGAREIEGLSSIYILDMYHMEGLRMHCLDIKLNPVVYWPLIESLRRMRESEDDIHRLIVQDAPREMLRALFGLNPREYSRLRRTLTATPAVGRPRGADEESSRRLWEALQEHGEPEYPDQLEPGFFLELADETGLTLRTIWRMLQLWCEHGRLDEDS